MQKFVNRGHVAPRGFTLIELLVVIAIIGILAGIVLASLGSARSGANDAKTKEQLSGLRSAMESYYASNGSYGTAGSACNTSGSAFVSSGVSPLVTAANYASNSIACSNTTSAWAVAVTLTTNTTAWCVDSTGASKQVTITASTPSTGISSSACI